MWNAQLCAPSGLFHTESDIESVPRSDLLYVGQCQSHCSCAFTHRSDIIDEMIGHYS